ncbi:MAG: aspartate aminotransferase family protein [Deltaproteobacteria bacterium]|nr:aspartate aminotransferase family protein [Nannocystaceae bacterium]
MDDLRWPTYANRKTLLDSAVFDDVAPGQGSMRVRDHDGNVYLDAVGGIGCLPLGHGHPKWIAAVESQMRRLVAAAGTFWTEPQQDLAHELARRVPLKDARTFIGNTGTEVTEAAIKLALRATGRDVILVLDRAFHGRTLGAIAMTANLAYRQPYVTCIGEEGSSFAHMNVARTPFGDLDALAAAFDRYAGRIAMLAIEPIQGEAGIYPSTREFLVGARELCTKNGALLGADEIQSGSGRTGHFLAWTTLVGDDPALQPDLVWLAKAIGGGFPVAACVTTDALAQHMIKGSHGSTFGGNPLAAAAAVATLRIMDDDGLLATAAAQLPTLQKIAAGDPEPRVLEIRGSGAMIGIQIAGESQPAAPLADAMQKLGVLVTICSGHTVRVLLPYSAGVAELRQIWTTLRQALAA